VEAEDLVEEVLAVEDSDPEDPVFEEGTVFEVVVLEVVPILDHSEGLAHPVLE